MSIKSTASYEIKEIFRILWLYKYLVLSITSFFAIFSVFYALSLPNIYTSSAMLAPSSSNETLSSKLSSFSSLAGIAGVNFPAAQATKSQEAIQRIRSQEFFTNFILPNIKLEDLFAVKEWNQKTNLIEYNDDIFDAKNNIWVREVSFPKKIIPSSQEAYTEWVKLLNVTENKLTTFVRITINHQSPHIAKEWLDLIIDKINSSTRLEDQRIAKSSIDYLNEYSKSTNVQSLIQAIANLQEIQLQTLMISSYTEDYVFKTLESPIVPELKSEPKRSIICILITIIGGILSVITALSIHFYNEIKQQRK